MRDKKTGHHSPFAVVLHCFYPDLARRALESLASISSFVDVWVTAPEDDAAFYRTLVSDTCPAATLVAFPNRGMDVIPFLSLVPRLKALGYKGVVKLHTKKGSDDSARIWADDLFTRSIQPEFVTRCCDVLKDQPSLDFVGFGDYFLSARRLMLGNGEALEKLVTELGSQVSLPADWGFFAGTMFAARLDALMPLSSWAENNAALIDTAYKQDGLLVHALERAFTLLARRSSKSIGLLHRSNKPGDFAIQQVAVDEGISQAYTRQLAAQLQSLGSDYACLSECGLLNFDEYPLSGAVDGQVDIHHHYLLVGQFDDRRKASLAWSLKRHNDCELQWSEWQSKTRVGDLTTVVIPVFNQPELTRRCIDAVFSVHTDVRFEVVCVDNGSDSRTADVLKQLAAEYSPLTVVSIDENLNFALGCNIGFGASKGGRVVYLNNDTEVCDGWLDHLVRRLDQGDCFAVQPQLRYPDGNMQCMGVVFSEKSVLGYPIYADMPPEACQAEKPRKFKALTAACIMFKASDFAAEKGFDALYINGQEDVDLCLRLHERTGKLGAYVPDSVVVHHESKSQGRGRWITQNRQIFVHRWAGKVTSDDLDYYNEDGFEVDSWLADSTSREEVLRVYRPVLKKRLDTLFVGNQAFANGNLSHALLGYWRAALAMPELQPFIEPSFHWVRAAHLKQRREALARGEPVQLAVSCWELAHNPAGRALALLEAWQPQLPQVEMIGCIFPRFGRELWAPMKDMSFPCHYFICDDESRFLHQAVELVMAHPYDVLHVSKPRLPSLIFAWLYRLFWGTQVILDIDDEELAFAGVSTPRALSMPEVEKSLLEETTVAWHRGIWTQLAVGQVEQFSLRTVSNVALQARYGGEVLEHLRPASRFEPSAELRRCSRQRWSIPEQARVVLFAGTPRKHKGLMQVAEALAALEDPNVWLVIAGDFPKDQQSLKQSLQDMAGLRCLCLPGQPYNRIAETIALGDVTVLLQDTSDLAAQFQLPAKLIDALAMGLTVLATPTPPLQPMIEAGVITAVNEANLKARLAAALNSDLEQQAFKNREYFLKHLAVESRKDQLKDLKHLALHTPREKPVWEGQLSKLINFPLEWVVEQLK